MRVQSLFIKHFKGIREFKVIAKDVNEIAGPNAAGKSSVLDAIKAALGGKKEIESKPLKDGESKGQIVLETDELIIKRNFKEGSTPTIIITSKANEKVGQRDLDQMFTSLTFDPLAFSRMKPERQIRIIQRLAGQEYIDEMKKIDVEIDETYQERALTNRELKKIGKIEKVEKVEEVNTSKLHEKLDETMKFNNQQSYLQNERDFTKERIDRFIKDREELEGKLERLDIKINGLREVYAELEKPKKLKTTKDLKNQLEQAGETNRRAQEYKDYLKRLKEYKEISKRSNQLDLLLEKLREKKKNHEKSVKLPVKNLTFNDDGLRVDNIPFGQLASSQQIRISAKIAMSINNKLKIMLVKDGSLLDDKSFKELCSIANKTDYQLWIETVGDGHGDAIHLEEGEIKNLKKKELPF